MHDYEDFYVEGPEQVAERISKDELNKLPRCSQINACPDCILRIGDKCFALQVTSFTKRCPFYKTAKDVIDQEMKLNKKKENK